MSARIKILLVDDKENNLLSMESVLWQDGYQIIKATSGKEALKILLKEMDFTLILMDVEMPELNGFETASMIYQRDRLRHIPIIFLSAHDDPDERVAGLMAGAVDYVRKPYSAEEVALRVRIPLPTLRRLTREAAEQIAAVAVE